MEIVGWGGLGKDSMDILDNIFERVLTNNVIFRNRDVLRSDYIPDRILFRDDQIAQLGQILAPVLAAGKPSNVFLYGKTGTGKTVVAKYVLRKLSEKARNLSLRLGLVYVNTRTASTPYRVLFEIGSQIGVTLPFTGLSISEALNRILRRIAYRGMRMIVVLDEIDFLVKNFNDHILYEFTRSSDKLPRKSYISVIGISNDLKFKEYLDPRVLSSLSEEELVFPPYTVDELEAILKDRISLAFNQGVVSESALKLCATLAATEHGDARRAVDLLRVAGELAEREGSDRVTVDHVKKAFKSIERDRVYETVRSLPIHTKLILLVVALSSDELNTGRLYSRYLELCKRVGLDALTQRRVSGLVSELDVLGLVNAPVVSGGRFGRSKKIKMAVPRESVLEALREDDLLQALLS